MIDISFNSPILWILTLLGLAVSILSALENRVTWIDAFCSFFGEGCRRTAEFTLFGLPIAWWGIAYYLLVGAVLLAVEPLLFWVVMAGVGVELTFLKIMAIIRAFCIFCLFNAVVVVLLLAGVHATPSFIINGRLKTGPLAVKEFEEIIEEELDRAGA
jgi:uncharacterized membrane protein